MFNAFLIKSDFCKHVFTIQSGTQIRQFSAAGELIYFWAGRDSFVHYFPEIGRLINSFKQQRRVSCEFQGV